MLAMIASISILLVAVLHFWFCILEMFFWRKPKGRKIFRLSEEFANQSAHLAANQGLYNAFLSAGLIWSLLCGDPIFALQLKLFFLSCVTIAGIYGAFTVNVRIFLVQALPGIVALGLLFVIAWSL